MMLGLAVSSGVVQLRKSMDVELFVYDSQVPITSHTRE